MSDARRYGEMVDRYGLSLAHQKCIEWIDDGSRVLELGCATGAVGGVLVADKGCAVVGAEIDSAAAALARDRGVDVRVGSLEDAEFRATIDGPFDAVTATDVLEHLRNPEAVLDEMHRWLKPGGMAVVAVPNVAAWSMRARLLRGDFTYEETGLLDRTHLRFYTWDTFHALVEAHGFRVEDRAINSWEVPGLQGAWEWSHATIRRLEEPEGEGPLSRWGRLFARRNLARFASAHQRWGASLGEHLPNLCANHIALRLRPAR